MTQFQTHITREPNKLGSFISPHFKIKRLYFIIKKNSLCHYQPISADVSINL